MLREQNKTKYNFESRSLAEHSHPEPWAWPLNTRLGALALLLTPRNIDLVPLLFSGTWKKGLISS